MNVIAGKIHTCKTIDTGVQDWYTECILFDGITTEKLCTIKVYKPSFPLENAKSCFVFSLNTIGFIIYRYIALPYYILNDTWYETIAFNSIYSLTSAETYKYCYACGKRVYNSNQLFCNDSCAITFAHIKVLS